MNRIDGDERLPADATERRNSCQIKIMKLTQKIS
jgi:hypothetical protein